MLLHAYYGKFEFFTELDALLRFASHFRLCHAGQQCAAPTRGHSIIALQYLYVIKWRI